MLNQETVRTVRLSWQASESTFSVFDPDFRNGESLAALLQAPPGTCLPSTTLRYVGVCEQPPAAGLLGLDCHHWAPGLHFVNMPERKLELLVHIGSSKTGLNEFQGRFDAVMLDHAAQRHGRWLKPHGVAPMPAPHRVAVVGAGMAGSSVALALCKQGIEVHLYDAADGPANGASGNWVGAFHPHITRGDSPLSRLSRLGFEHTQQALAALTAQGLLEKGVDWDTPGHLQTVPADDNEHVLATLEQLDFPESLVRWANPDELLPTPLGGLYFPQGGWVKPARWVQANLRACGRLLYTHYGCELGNLDALRAEFDAVVVCCAEQSLTLAPIQNARVGSVKGQISKFRCAANPRLVLSGESYAISPNGERWMVLGATYERPVLDLNPTDEADNLNLERFRTAFPQWPVGELLDHRCAVRSVWHDRLPAIGPVPDMPGVYMSTGFASRGLLWAALGGWIVAGHCSGQPFESKLLRKIIPRAAKA